MLDFFKRNWKKILLGLSFVGGIAAVIALAATGVGAIVIAGVAAGIFVVDGIAIGIDSAISSRHPNSNEDVPLLNPNDIVDTGLNTAEQNNESLRGKNEELERKIKELEKNNGLLHSALKGAAERESRRQEKERRNNQPR